MNNRVIYILLSTIIFLVGGAFLWVASDERTITIGTMTEVVKKMMAPISEMQLDPDFSPLRANEIQDVSDAFQFSSMIPVRWRAEAVPAIGAINVYDPNSTEPSNLEKSQIFIRSFSANDFLTLSTVTILSVSDFFIDDRPTRQYVIVKKPGVSPFANQPSWRSEEHVVTDVRVSDQNPSVFYVIAKRPDLDETTYQAFLDNLSVIAGSATSLVEPTAEFHERITKKPLGIYITPETSPVQPDRFTGYHTGVDVEFVDETAEVPVRAVTDGTVALSRTASGYGGVIIIQHRIFGRPYSVLYGHLDPASLVSKSSIVSAGQIVGVLGEGETFETDGARKHLHFSVKEGTSTDIRGYVASQSELAAWTNPLDLFEPAPLFPPK
jgi:murein DD-endopeptidase MepM/ murein hydrolase activator NlpD